LANMEEVSLSGWRRTMEKCHLDIDFYVHQRWDTNQRLPWEILDLGTKPEKLGLELNRALAYAEANSPRSIDPVILH